MGNKFQRKNIQNEMNISLFSSPKSQSEIKIYYMFSCNNFSLWTENW